MKLNIIIFISLIIIHIILIILTILKLIHIKNNNSLYEHNELIRETNKKYKNKWNNYCKLFQSLAHQYGFLLFFLSFIIIIIFWSVIVLINRLNATSNYIFLGTQLIGGIGIMFLGGVFGMLIIPLAIKRPFFVVATSELFNTEYRPQIYFRAYLTLLIILVVTAPFTVLSCNNYAYYDDNGITINKYFKLHEQFVSYEEINKVEIKTKYSGRHESLQLDYTIYYLGESIEINSPNTSNEKFKDYVVEIHNHLIKTNSCEFVIKPLTDEEIKYYKEELSKEEYEVLLDIFNME